jgi:hypothetical protein
MGSDDQGDFCLIPPPDSSAQQDVATAKPLNLTDSVLSAAALAIQNLPSNISSGSFPINGTTVANFTLRVTQAIQDILLSLNFTG